MHYFSPKILRVLLGRWESELALNSLLGLSLLELDNQLARCEPISSEQPLVLAIVVKPLQLLQRLLVDQLREGRLLHHLHRRQLVFMQQFLPVLRLLPFRLFALVFSSLGGC